jgi:hypothetical protein
MRLQSNEQNDRLRVMFNTTNEQRRMRRTSDMTQQIDIEHEQDIAARGYTRTHVTLDRPR